MVNGVHLFVVGEYHHHDFFVYPRITKVPKSFFDRMVDTGKSIMHRVLGSNNQVDDVEEVDISTLSMENMAKKCLHFYLDPHMNNLMDDKHTADLKIDIFVQRIADLYFQHLNPSVRHRQCPSNDFIVKVNTRVLLSSSNLHNVYLSISMSYMYIFFHRR